MPHYLAIGVSKAEFMESCPAELKSYDAAHKLQMEEQNRMLWLNGMYISDAIMSTLGNSAWFRPKGAKVNVYPKEPYSLCGAKQMTKEDRMREVDRFLAQESVRRANWRQNHKRQE